eukprot:gnl/Dysnectes_brevis/1605_a1818_1134.p1 GENE.gnl/Dysnectes_brevis/1605_a1818_1134~~gnl/Dysnectes_brevis/1605_a1818_1134.p1  ORF type:complete len:786 (+),score=114.76 gnl/Dysnectes_brevis/1605_a1818_1134:761-3118(+)
MSMDIPHSPLASSSKALAGASYHPSSHNLSISFDKPVIYIAEPFQIRLKLSNIPKPLHPSFIAFKIEQSITGKSDDWKTIVDFGEESKYDLDTPFSGPLHFRVSAFHIPEILKHLKPTLDLDPSSPMMFDVRDQTGEVTLITTTTQSVEVEIPASMSHLPATSVSLEYQHRDKLIYYVPPPPQSSISIKSRVKYRLESSEDSFSFTRWFHHPVGRAMAIKLHRLRPDTVYVLCHQYQRAANAMTDTDVLYSSREELSLKMLDRMTPRGALRAITPHADLLAPELIKVDAAPLVMSAVDSSPTLIVEVNNKKMREVLFIDRVTGRPVASAFCGTNSRPARLQGLFARTKYLVSILSGPSRLFRMPIDGQSLIINQHTGLERREFTRLALAIQLRARGVEDTIMGIRIARHLPRGLALAAVAERAVRSESGKTVVLHHDIIVWIDHRFKIRWHCCLLDRLSSDGSCPIGPSVRGWMKEPHRMTPVTDGAISVTGVTAIEYLRSEGNLLVALGPASRLVKIRARDGKGDGQILWSLGRSGDFKLSVTAGLLWTTQGKRKGRVKTSRAGVTASSATAASVSTDGGDGDGDGVSSSSSHGVEGSQHSERSGSPGPLTDKKWASDPSPTKPAAPLPPPEHGVLSGQIAPKKARSDFLWFSLPRSVTVLPVHGQPLKFRVVLLDPGPRRRMLGLEGHVRIQCYCIDEETMTATLENNVDLGVHSAVDFGTLSVIGPEKYLVSICGVQPSGHFNPNSSRKALQSMIMEVGRGGKVHLLMHIPGQVWALDYLRI